VKCTEAPPGCPRPGDAAGRAAATVVGVTLLPETRRDPLTADELAAALDRTHGDSRAAAALLLALPLGELPVVAAKLEQDRWQWRGVERDFTGDCVADVAALVFDGRQSGDRFVVPDGEPWQWVRPTRSGHKIIVWGADTLLGAPSMSADPDVTLDQIWSVLRAWWHGELTEAPAIYSGSDGDVLVTGTEDAWHLLGAGHSSAATAAADVRPLEVRTLSLCASLARSLGADQVVCDDFETTEWGTRTVARAHVDGYLIEVPVTFSPTSTLIGAGPHDLRPGVAAAPGGFSVAGIDAAGRVVCQAPDGTWVRIAR
jgi:hypothetical protein